MYIEHMKVSSNHISIYAGINVGDAVYIYMKGSNFPLWYGFCIRGCRHFSIALNYSFSFQVQAIIHAYGMLLKPSTVFCVVLGRTFCMLISSRSNKFVTPRITTLCGDTISHYVMVRLDGSLLLNIYIRI